MWVDMEAEIDPTHGRGRPWRRWQVEMNATFSDFNDPIEKAFPITYHFYQHDYWTLTLRSAMKKAWNKFEDMQDELEKGPIGDWPWPLDDYGAPIIG